MRIDPANSARLVRFVAFTMSDTTFFQNAKKTPTRVRGRVRVGDRV